MLPELYVSYSLVLMSVMGIFWAKDFPNNAGYLPIVALGVLILSLLFVIIDAHQRNKEKKHQTLTVSWKYFVTILITIVFFFSFDKINYFVTAPIYIFVVCLLLEISWKKALASSFVASSVIYLVFIKWLGVFIDF